MAENLAKAMKYLKEAEASGKFDKRVDIVLDGMSKKLQSIVDSSTAKWDRKPLIEELRSGKANRRAYECALKIYDKKGLGPFITSDLYSFINRYDDVAEYLHVLWIDGFMERKLIPTNTRYFERRLVKEGVELIQKSLKAKAK